MEPQASSRKSQDAFTLVELLVVITIIAILLALLTPALDTAMEQAVRLSCQTRMRALNTAMQLYVMDHKRWLPEWLALTDETVGGVPTGRKTTGLPYFWWHRLHTYRYIRDHGFDVLAAGAVGPAASSPFACPEAANHGENGNNSGLLPQWIAYNIALGFDNANPGNWWEPYRHVRISKVERPLETMMFGDCFRSSAYSATVRGDYILAFGNVDTEAGLANLTKHNGTANFAFVDGHAENLSKAESQYRADRGRTGAGWKTEYFFLPFPSSLVYRP